MLVFNQRQQCQCYISAVFI